MKFINKIVAFIGIIGTTAVFTGCSKDFLEKYPQDTMTDEDFWTKEENIRTFSYGFYTGYFTGYGSGFTWGNYFSGQAFNDDFASSSPGEFTRIVPETGGGWGFTWVRKANVFLERIQRAPISEEANKHWSGVARFFRAMEYHDMVSRFGDVPFYDQVISETDLTTLYKPRDPRSLVVDKILEDLQFAAENVRVADVGEKGLYVNKDVVLAFMSRIMLFQGTWLKYHTTDQARAKTYLEAAKWASNELITSKRYTLGPNYRDLFSSLSLTGNPEMIMYRRYVTGLLTHALMSYNNKEAQTGISRDAVRSYLSKDGLPVDQSPLYQGDHSIADVLTDRDPRLNQILAPEYRLVGVSPNSSTSGYAVMKFLNEGVKNNPEGSGSLNETDAPIIRYAEVLLNYAEAVAELGNLTQTDLDLSINVIRSRAGVSLPKLEVTGQNALVDGVSINDPERDPTISPILWEIRRERRVELMMEGFRYNDLRRWKLLPTMDTNNHPEINLGAWINKDDYKDGTGKLLVENLTVTGGPTTRIGYIKPAFRAETQRIFTGEKVYLNPIPRDQIRLYKDQGVTLTQNPGWED
ncbi:RagB/SusD family nutrient uptake outer membrane protein [Sphingobacterium sp. HJSM2_6]|uniref:RagB/SusD family nutrient uptake outer membrane protein n=1 Tax=Sphingobacterium sp. HJSM2_6 TaxID=3366264 RepID=UPI003BE6D14A